MKARLLNQVRQGQTLSPSLVSGNLRQLEKDIRDAQSRRYTYSSFVLDFSGITEASSAADRAYDFFAPFVYDIVGVELVYYASSTNVSNVTATFTRLVGTPVQKIVSVANAGVGARSAGSISDVLTIGTSNNLVVQLGYTNTGAFTLNSCKVIVYICTSKIVDTTAFTPAESSLPRPGQTTSNSTLNSLLTTATSVAGLLATTNNVSRTIQVINRRNIGAVAFATSMQTVRVPASSRRLTHMQAGLVCANTSTVGFALRNTANSADLESVSLQGAGSTTLTTSSLTATSETLSITDPGDTVDDNKIRFTRVAGADAISHMYVVLFWDR